MATNQNPLLFRYPPNTRFTKGAFKEQTEVKIKIDDFGKSITDKESYRLSLINSRGASGGSFQQGYYMFPDGKYDYNSDFSFILRKDLSITEIDGYLDRMKEDLKDADENTKKEIESQMKAFEEKKAVLEIAETSKKKGSDAEAKE